MFKSGVGDIILKTYTCVRCNKQFQSNSRFTFQEKYGGIGFGSDVISDKINKTNQVRYDTIHPTKSEKIKDKIRSTCLSKYGVNNYKQSEQSRKYVMTDPTKIHHTKNKNIHK